MTGNLIKNNDLVTHADGFDVDIAEIPLYVWDAFDNGAIDIIQLATWMILDDILRDPDNVGFPRKTIIDRYQGSLSIDEVEDAIKTLKDVGLVDFLENGSLDEIPSISLMPRNDPRTVRISILLYDRGLTNRRVISYTHWYCPECENAFLSKSANHGDEWHYLVIYCTCTQNRPEPNPYKGTTMSYDIPIRCESWLRASKETCQLVMVNHGITMYK